MPKMHGYLTTLRIAYTARSDLHASVTAEHFRQHVENILEETDTVDTTQVIPFGQSEIPEEIINRLRAARNELVRLKFRDTMDLAQSLDQVIWALLSRTEGDEALAPGYDYNRIDTISRLLDKGETPLI